VSSPGAVSASGRPPEQGSPEAALAHQLGFRALPTVGETPAGRGPQGVDAAAVGAEKRAPPVGGFDRLEASPVRRRLEVGFGAFPFVHPQPSGYAGEILRGEEHRPFPPAAGVATPATVTVARFRVEGEDVGRVQAASPPRPATRAIQGAESAKNVPRTVNPAFSRRERYRSGVHTSIPISSVSSRSPAENFGWR